MSTESRQLLSNISLESSDSSFIYSEKKQAAGYHRLFNPLHTATYRVDSFIGTIKIQGTLSLYPSESDWFDIPGTEIGFGEDSTAWNPTNSINFTGNYVWIRAAYNLQNGTINEIRYNY
jgi:hypothetical protein